MRLLPLTTLLLVLALALLNACPKKQAAETSQVPRAPEPGQHEPVDAGDEFIAEPEVKPLAQSPLNISGVSLGVSPDFQGSRYEGLTVDIEQEWREEGWTGIQWRSFTDKDGETEETSYFNEGRLVGFKRINEAEETGFTEKIDLITMKYGDPWTDLPDYLAQSTAWEDFSTGEPDQTVFWVDPPTQTVIAGRYDVDVASSTWLLFQPEQLVAVRGEVMAAMGS